MDVQELKQYWLELSDYDLETAQAMLDTKRYLYVGFMAHQSVEKALKAYYVSRIAKVAPYTHDLWRLSEASGLKDTLTEDSADLLDELQPLNIEARYPRDKQYIMDELTEDYCRRLLEKTVEVQSWIKQMC